MSYEYEIARNTRSIRVTDKDGRSLSLACMPIGLDSVNFTMQTPEANMVEVAVRYEEISALRDWMTEVINEHQRVQTRRK